MSNLYSIEIHAHRGARDRYPENTLPAFHAAVASHADLLELDVQITKDGIVVVHHNFSLNPEICCHSDGSALQEAPLIHSLELNDLKKLDVGQLTSKQFPMQLSIKGTKIPTLEELIESLEQSSDPHAKFIRLNIEIKRDMRSPELSLPAKQIVEKVLTIIDHYNFSDRVQYSSFDPEVLIELRKHKPDAILSCLFAQEILDFISVNLGKPGMEFIYSFAKEHKIDILSPEHDILQTKTQVQKMQQAGFRVVAWTVNDIHRYEELKKMGVDGIITDTPHTLTKHR